MLIVQLQLNISYKTQGYKSTLYILSLPLRFPQTPICQLTWKSAFLIFKD